MSMLDDKELDRAPEPSFGRTSGQDGPPLIPIAIVGAGLIVAFLAGGAWWMSRQPPASSNATPKAVASTDVPIATPAPDVALPPLDQMDGFLRPLLAALSNRPELARWLATDDLVKQIASAIDQASQGKNPARDFKVIAPDAPLGVAGRNTRRRTIDPAGYRRYNSLVTTITSIDASAVARIYKTIRPRLNEAYRNMGHPDGNIDTATLLALEILLDTPVTKGPIELTEGAGARWAFTDPKLEGLSSTQKQLVRMGPEHTEQLLIWLRSLRSGLE